MLIHEIKWYSLIGVFNTLLHAAVFALGVWVGLSSAWANGVAFWVAATFSFFANAKWTFQRIASKTRYVLFIGLMGTLAWLTGYLTDFFRLPAWLAVIFFSLLSWIIGFISAKKIIFK